MRKRENILDYTYPYYWTDENENGDFIITIFPSLDDKLNRTNGKTYKYSISLNPNIDDSVCCRVRINGKYYYFG